VAQQATPAGVEDSRRDLVQHELLVADVHGMTSVRAALIPRHDLYLLGEDVDDLPLPLVAPLGADDDHTAMLHLSGVLVFTPPVTDGPGCLCESRGPVRRTGRPRPRLCPGRTKTGRSRRSVGPPSWVS